MLRSLVVLLAVFHFTHLFSQPGSLDTGFGTQGLATFSGWDDYYAKSIAIQQDGKILETGVVFLDNLNRAQVVRFNSDGSVDTSFGENGGRIIDFGQTVATGLSVLESPDKSIYLIGPLQTYHSSCFVAKLTPDGKMDSSFNNTGVRAYHYAYLKDEWADSGALQPDGKVIIAGYLGGTAMLRRIYPNGAIDSTYGINGISTPKFGAQFGRALKVIALPDQKLLGMGFLIDSIGIHTTVFKLDQYGRPDSLGFGVNGVTIVDTAYGSIPLDMALTPDGKILVKGVGYIFKFDEHGSFDPSFGNGGILPFLSEYLTVQYDGKIIATYYQPNNQSWNFDVIRLFPDGTIDSTFGVNGVATANFNQYLPAPTGVLMQQDGKILCSGYLTVGGPGHSQQGFVRYLSGLELSTQDFSHQQPPPMQTYPNPLRHGATLRYELSQSSPVTIQLFSLDGRLLKVYLNQSLQSGGRQEYPFEFPPELKPGAYLMEVHSVDGVALVKLIKM